MEGENSNDLIGDPGFLSSVVEIEMECWQNDILGTKEVLMKLGCSSAKAEKAIGSYLGRRFSRREYLSKPDPWADFQNHGCLRVKK